VAQAAQLFANLTQPGQQQRNGDHPQPAGDPDGSEPLPDVHEVYELLQAALAANKRIEKAVQLLRHDLDTTISNVNLLQAALAADERAETTVEFLRDDLHTTISNVKLLHEAVTKALRFLNKRVGALERE